MVFSQRVSAFHLAILISTSLKALNYATLGNMVLQSEPAIKNAQAINARWNPQDLEACAITDIDLSVKVPNRFEQHKLAFTLLHTFYELPEEMVLDVDGIESLALISKKFEATLSLLDIFPTKTSYGKAITAKKLALAHAHAADILPVQQGVRALVEQPALQAQLHSSLGKIALYEPYILSLFEPNNKETKKVFDHFYYSDANWNKNIKALTLLRAYQTLYSEPLLTLPRNIVEACKGWCFLQFGQFSQRLFVRTVAGNNAYEEDDFVKQLSALMAKELPPLEQTWKFWFVMNASLVVVSGLETVARYAIKQVTKPIPDQTIAHMHTKLRVVAAFIRTAQELHAALTPYQKHVPAFNTIYTELNNYFICPSADMMQLNTLLQADIFQRDGTIGFMDSVRTLAAYKLLEQNKKLFIPLLYAMGNLDALHAAASLYLENQNDQGNSYCFVTLLEQTAPALTLENFWNPFMQANEAVANTLMLGSGTQGMVITGPNGSGKSVFMKSVALNLVLAQSFGIAAAQSATITPFDTFHIYLNVQENLELSLSTFMAEKKKMDEICTRVTTQETNKKSFTLIDEGLKGTVEQSGGPHIHKAGMAMSGAANNICLLATHFNKPTDLEADTNGIFKNYHLGLTEPHEGTFNRTFVLEPGKNSWWFTDDAKRERFITWLTSDV